MITLYVKDPCPYSARAIAALDAYGIPFVEKNIADPVFGSELVELGGKHKVPYLIDDKVHLYESDDIVSYIETTYGKTAHGK